MKRYCLLLLFLANSFSLFAQLSTENLLAYYPFNGDVMDYGPSAYHGLMNGGVFVANAQGVPNSALKLDGIRDYVDLTAFAEDFRNNLDQMTIYFLVKFEDASPDQTILSLGNHGESLTSNVFEIEYENNHFQVETEIRAEAINIELEIDQTPNIVDSDWHEVFIRINGDSLEYCRDGELVYAGLYTPAETSTDEFFLGCFDGDGANACCHLNGIVDELQFYSSLRLEVFDTIRHTSCESEVYQTLINNTVYDINNPTGTELIRSDCFRDTVLTIDLEFLPSFERIIEETHCTGENFQIEVNGTAYNSNNPFGVELLSTVEGCDSTITVDLKFVDQIDGEFNQIVCQEEDYSIEINGTTYDHDNPNGVEVFNLGSCDSIVIINLEFLQPSTDTVSYSGCRGDGYSIIINNVTYDEANPNGMEVLQSGLGCDSLVYIDLEFSDDDCLFFIPNIVKTKSNFPNNVFQIYTSNSCEYRVEKCLIFDRWGGIVYEADESIYWDGLVNGKNVEDGVYVYYLVLDNRCGQITKTGSVTVLN